MEHEAQLKSILNRVLNSLVAYRHEPFHYVPLRHADTALGLLSILCDYDKSWQVIRKRLDEAKDMAMADEGAFLSEVNEILIELARKARE